MNRSAAQFVLSVVLCVYWGHVLSKAVRIRQKNRRSANVVPAEPLGRALRLLWAPVVLLWVATPAATALFATKLSLLRQAPLPAAFAWAGAASVVFCYLGTRRAWKALGRHWRMGIDPAEKNAFVRIGPFARVRHPIYAWSIGMMLASLMAVPNAVMSAVACCHIGLLAWESIREERHLLRVHGSRYADYCKTAGRFLPRLSS